MAVLNQKKVVLVNDETSMRNPDSSSGIYLTTDKVAQFRLVAGNRREKEEAKKETAKKTFTQKLNLQQMRCEAFQKFQDSMNSLSSSTTEELMFINLINLSSTIIKDAFAHIRGKLGGIPNQRRETVSREMINFFLGNLSGYHQHHHVTPLLFHHATPLLPMDHHIYHVICHPSPMYVSTPSSCHPSPLYVDHHLIFM